MRDSHTEVRRYALKLLSYRSRSRKELRERLKQKGFDSDQIDSSMQFLEQAGLIKDEALASELLRNAVEKKYLGRNGIRMFLLNRGIEKDMIDETLSNLSEDAEKEAALKLVGKKLKILGKYPENIIKRRLWGMLQRRGFSSDIINLAVKSITK